MPDLIRLLPDSVANQIAAGEVIQRPASAIKEMLENAIDAGALNIRLIIKDAGKSLIQVIDNGSGMSETDARMSFERHATSKIRDASDLFSIKTLGFRGEALASIAAVAQVEMKTRKQSSEIGTHLIIEGTRVKSQEPAACPAGTSISVRNLFFNVPARRNFLKSDQVEYRHILEEFQRVAIVHPDIEFSLYNNDKLALQLPPEKIKQRIVRLFGNQYNEKLLPVELNSEYVSISGYVGKPEAARKTRGEQYFFANGRFIRHPYLHHAVEQAFEELIPDSAFPSYFLFIDVDPGTIDVNIHPTKTEVNFQHGQLLYGALRTAVKHALGMFTLVPQLDFETEPSFNVDPPKNYEPKLPTITVNPDYNPFKTQQEGYKRPSEGLAANRGQWEQLFEVAGNKPQSPAGRQPVHEDLSATHTAPVQQVIDSHSEEQLNFQLFQVFNRYILTNSKSGMMVIDQAKAHERIIFERLCSRQAEEKPQRSLFPQTLHFSPVDSQVLHEIIDELTSLGFEISDLGNGSFLFNALPAGMTPDDTQDIVDELIEGFKRNKADFANNRQVRIAALMAGKLSVKPGKALQPEEMQNLFDDLFRCTVPNFAPDGAKVFRIIPLDEIEKMLR